MARAVHRSGLVALGIATALMASCAFAAKDVVVAVGSNFTTLDPYDANDTLSQAVAKSFYQGLFGLDKEMKLKNVLAESYTVSDDGLTYTVKLREGIKFQDGTDFNAAAVKANLDRASDPANHLKRYNLYKNIAKTEAIDPTTVKITLKQPFSAFINILAHPATAMISPAALEKYGKDIGFHPVGTGPYELDTWNQTDFVKVKKFAFYSNKQVDDFLAQALKTNDPAEKTRLYKAAQDIIWQESPWIPLVVEKLVSAHSKNLTGFWIMPDTGFSFEDADLQ